MKLMERFFGRRDVAQPENGDLNGSIESPGLYASPTSGQINRVVKQLPCVGYETTGLFATTLEQIGEEFGHVRVDDETALKDEAEPRRFAAAGGRVRSGVGRQEHVRGLLAPRRVIAQTAALMERAKAHVEILGERLRQLQEDVLPSKTAAVEAKRAIVETAKSEFHALPRSAQGYIERAAIVWLIEIGVVTFDAAVVHGALERAGLGQATLWITTGTVPFLIWAANHSFGVLAGAIGLRVPREDRLRLAAITFIGGAAALGIAFVTLAVFRAQAADAQNAALQALARGDNSATLQFFLSPLWMGPLQVAGSIAAIVAVALWTIGREGRAKADDIRKAEAEVVEAQAAQKQTEADLERTMSEMEAARLAVFQVTADGEAAKVEVENRTELFQALEETEEALAAAVAAKYATRFLYVDKVYANGGVIRCAMPTVPRSLGRRARGPQDRTAAPAAAPKASDPATSAANGRKPGHHINPNTLTPPA